MSSNSATPASGQASSSTDPQQSRTTSPPPRKRSKWEATPSPDALERAANEARAKAASKALRAKQKAERRAAERQQEERQRHNGGSADATEDQGQSANGSGTPQRRAAAQSLDEPRSAAARQQAHRNVHPVPPRSAYPALLGCRSVNVYERLNHIEEGSYGVVFRARDKETGDVVALKKLKMDKEKNGFPITSLREIRTLMESRHENVVRVREIVVGDTLTQVYIVMDFIEHDLKSLLQSMRVPFLASEIKTLMHQLLSAMSLLHNNWIIHRDLKTSNLLMNNSGQIKLADFGLARTFGEPRKPMTELVVTLWYRSPELLLGAPLYGTEVDMWSVGCIFAELILKEPFLPGKNENEQLLKIFKLLGQPSEDVWPGWSRLPGAKNMSNVAPLFSSLRQHFRYSTEQTLDLLARFLTYDPSKRITADEALAHPYFDEPPRAAHPSTFGSFPSVAAGEK
ncbi:Pkinase-domain-containing protein [Ceraceosorus guamensis]|uniref:cyclin-dependent kinase n=1 Tax=Ceraceosorus guamensis TaxID=1522189 RepID=A0A316W767_9BASI|nr:Pkinase-domain-containing protein [Ceraceosorus guamensis]PWN45707.1 Pkinase-domain-containing protein [Ceraceosorus guamensis]